METGFSAGMYTSISLNDDAQEHRQSATTSSVRRPTILTVPRSHRQRESSVREEEPEPEETVTFSRIELRDDYNLVYLSMVLAGIGYLLPYNSFVNAVDFYQKRFDSHLIIFDISMTYITVMLISVLVTNLLVKKVHLRWRITFGYMVAIVVLFLITFFDIILNAFPTNWSYSLTLLSVAVISLGCTIQQSSFYGYTSLLPRRFTQAVMLGESCAGLIVSLNRIFTKSAVTSAAPSTALFFILSSCMLLVCLLTFTLGVKSQFVRQFIQPTSTSRQHQEQPLHQQRQQHRSQQLAEDRVRMLPSGLDNPAYQAEMLDLGFIDDPQQQQPSIQTTPDSTHHQADITGAAAGGGLSSAEAEATAETDEVLGDEEQRQADGAQSSLDAGLQLRLTIAHSIWLYMSAIALCYFTTLSLFPGIESEIPSCRLKDWMPVVLMAVFNGFDLLGKLLAAFPVAWKGAPLLVCSLFRFCLVPLFMSSASPRQKPHINSESWAFFITGLLGVSNGYFGSVPMINAPKTVQSSHREIAGNLMTLSYSVGLTAGSGISYWLDDLLGPIPAKLKTWEYACGFYNVSHVIGR